MSTKTTQTGAVERLLTVGEVGSRLALSRSATYNLLSHGVLPAIRLPGVGSRCHVRVRSADLERFVNQHQVGAGQ